MFLDGSLQFPDGPVTKLLGFVQPYFGITRYMGPKLML